MANDAPKPKQPEDRNRIVIETPGVKDETAKPKIKLGPLHREEPSTREATPEEIHREKIKQRGGAYSDRIKIEPKFNAPPRKTPLPSPAELQRALRTPILTAQAGNEN